MIADRAPRLKKLIEKYQPDIIGLQEARPQWINFLENEVVGDKYSMFYQYRAKNNQEAQPILWNNNEYDLLDSGYYWLSDTPEVSSKGWGSKHYRGVTWGKFRIKETGQVFLFINTHLTGEDGFALNSAELIAQRTVENGGFTEHGVFLTGDFNFTPESIGYNALTKHFIDINKALGFKADYTLTNYNEWAEDDPNNRIIDYVMCSENYITPILYKVLNENIDGGWISDHRGLYVEAILN